MVHLTLAIGDFLLVLLAAGLWIGGGIVGVGMAGLGAIAGLFLAVRKWRRLR